MAYFANMAMIALKDGHYSARKIMCQIHVIVMDLIYVAIGTFYSVFRRALFFGT